MVETNFLIIVGVLYTAVFISGWLLSGRTRVYRDVVTILLISLSLTFLSIAIAEENPAMAYVGIIIAAAFIIGISLRIQVTYTTPVNKMRFEMENMLDRKDLTSNNELLFINAYDNLKKLFDTQLKLMEKYSTEFKDFENKKRISDKIVANASELSNKIDSDSTNMRNDIDENLQSAVVCNEISERIQLMVKNLSNQLIDFNHQMSKAISSSDTISDQTNLVAVNAAIEAAHSEQGGENFAIVADGIQSLSARSRKIVTNLNDINLEMNKVIKEKLNEIFNEFSNLDNTIYQIADLSDRISNVSYTQVNLGNELKSSIKEL